MSVKFEWETEFKETESGEIPRDWEVRNTHPCRDGIWGVTYAHCLQLSAPLRCYRTQTTGGYGARFDNLSYPKMLPL